MASQTREDAPAGSEFISNTPDPSIAHAPISAAQIVTSGLHFLETASATTLAACFVGLGSATVIILGRLGLLLLGAVLGVVLHATWEGTSSITAEANVGGHGRFLRRGESGIVLAERAAEWQLQKCRQKTDEDGDVPDKKVLLSTEETLDYSRLPTETGAALASLTDAVIRDYVRWWYSPILPAEQTFILTCRQTLTSFLLSISSHLARKRPADMFLDFLVNSSSTLIVFFNELARALSTSTSNTTASADEIQAYLSSSPESHLASLLDVNEQEKKLHALAEDILQTFLDPKVYSCEPAHVFLREMLAGVVLKMTVESCSKAEWINGWIVHLLGEDDLQFINAIDAGINAKPESTGSLEDVETNHATGVEQRALNKPTSTRQASLVSEALAQDKGPDKADAAMQEALLEAERLNRLIAEDDERILLESSRKSSVRLPESDGGRNYLESEQGGLHDTGSICSDKLNGHTSTSPKSEKLPGVIGSEISSPSKFTSFDQLIAGGIPTALQTGPSAYPAESPIEAESISALYRATISILDDSSTVNKDVAHSKTNLEYLIQIEPASNTQPGWMIVRKYVDFEELHEVLRRISVVAGVTEFQTRHTSLPSWKGQAKSSLRELLENYLQDALSHRQLAESEGMKRFFEKSQSIGRPSPGLVGKSGLPGAFGTVGKGVRDVFSSAPRSVGGVLGGVSPFGQKKRPRTVDRTNSLEIPNGSKSQRESNTTSSTIDRHTGHSSDKLGAVSPSPSHSNKVIIPELSYDCKANTESNQTFLGPDKPSSSSRSSLNEQYNTEHSQSSSFIETPQQSSPIERDEIHLPPLPTDIPDDYGSSADLATVPGRPKMSTIARPTYEEGGAASPQSVRLPRAHKVEAIEQAPDAATGTTLKKDRAPLSDQETHVAIELIFAVINELYTLSSAWNIRRTLLSAAKSFISLETVRQQLQTAVIDANTSDAVIASYINKIEQNTLPTKKELESWPAPLIQEEKEALRRKARKLLIDKGLPPALTSVMGGAASKEALGKVFDCLQVEPVARGLVFGLLLQALRTVTQ